MERPLVLLALSVLLAACAPAPAPRPAGAPGPQPAAPDPRTWELTPAEKDWIRAQGTRGPLRVAIPQNSFNPSVTEFHTELARSFGAFLGLPVEIRNVAFDRLFTRDGSLPPDLTSGQGPAYVPDVFREADLVAFDLTPLDWRRRLMEFYPVLPTRVVLVTPRGREAAQLSDLAGRKVAVYANTSHELYLKRIQADLGLRFEVVSTPFGTDLFALVRSGKADALVRDANTAIPLLTKNPGFNVTLPLMPTEWLCWAAPRGQPVLGALIGKFMAKVRALDSWDPIWRKAYGLSFAGYRNLVGEEPPLEWTPEEQEAIEGLRRTGLRVAIHREATEYEPQPDGSARGIAYNLVLETAKHLDVPLKLRPVSFPEYFSRGGTFPEAVKTDPQFTYQPDLLGQVDLYAGDFTPLEWRKKFLTFVSLYPSRLVFAVRKGEGLTGPAPGKKFALMVNTSYQEWIEAKALVRPQDIVLAADGGEALQMVADRRADITLSDANVVLGRIAQFPGITFFPADAPVDDISWAVAAGRPALASVVRKCLESFRASGIFAQVWKNYFHVSMDEYLALLAVDREPPP